MIRRLGIRPAVLIMIAVSFGGGWWAATTVTGSTSERVVGSQVPMTYRVEEGTVSQELVLSTVADWPEAGTISHRATGTVTTVDVASGAEVANGTQLFSVDLRPVVAMAGDIPSFRAMGVGVRGPDVLQLSRGLVAMRRLTKEREVFDETVASAVRAWQKRLGIEQTGVVEAGDVVFIPTLPRRIRLVKEVVVGAQLTPGGKALVLLGAAPRFLVPITSQQRARIPDGTRARVTYPDGVWEGIVGGVAPKSPGSEDEATSPGSQDAQVDLLITAADAGPVCADACGLVPADASRSFDTTLVLVPQATGLVVPIAALRTGSGGKLFVEDLAARRYPVKVVSEAKGLAVIEGVKAGLEVRITDEE